MKFKAGDKARLIRSVTRYASGTEVIVQYVDTDVTNLPYLLCLKNSPFTWVSESDLEPIEEHKAATVTIRAEEYANFQEMEKLLVKIYNTTEPVYMHPEIEKLLKNKYNP